MKKKAAVLLILSVFFLASPPPAHAQGILHKLGRGLQNIVTSPLEIVLQPFRLVRVDQKEEQALFIGIPQGLYFFVGRCLAGVYDTVTFPIPQEPIFYPETVFNGFRAAELGYWPYATWGFGSPPPPNALEGDPFGKKR